MSFTDATATFVAFYSILNLRSFPIESVLTETKCFDGPVDKDISP